MSLFNQAESLRLAIRIFLWDVRPDGHIESYRFEKTLTFIHNPDQGTF